MNCTTHKKIPAVYRCDWCGKPICEGCYEAFSTVADEGEHICAECAKKSIGDMIGFTKTAKSTAIKEIIFIVIGMLVGLFFGIEFYLEVAEQHAGDLGAFILVPIYIPFIGGSIITIIKKVKMSYVKQRVEQAVYDTPISILPTILISIIVAPITTIIQLIKSIGDIKRCNRTISDGEDILVEMDEHIKEGAHFTLKDTDEDSDDEYLELDEEYDEFDEDIYDE